VSIATSSDRFTSLRERNLMTHVAVSGADEHRFVEDHPA